MKIKGQKKSPNGYGGGEGVKLTDKRKMYSKSIDSASTYIHFQIYFQMDLYQNF